MDRRDFLRTSALTAAGGLVFAKVGGLLDIVGAGAATGSATPRWKGTTDGKIYVSYDNGKSWKLHTNFGSALAVTKVGPNSQKQVTSTLTLQGYSFNLGLQSDNKTWRTVAA